jgi:hypothetical protein
MKLRLIVTVTLLLAVLSISANARHRPSRTVSVQDFKLSDIPATETTCQNLQKFFAGLRSGGIELIPTCNPEVLSTVLVVRGAEKPPKGRVGLQRYHYTGFASCNTAAKAAEMLSTKDIQFVTTCKPLENEGPYSRHKLKVDVLFKFSTWRNP